MQRSVQNVAVPAFIYGTAWKEERTRDLVTLALNAGFRAIDTANQRRHYFEAGVGEALHDAIENGRVEREDLFLQTKFTYARGQDHRLPYDPHSNFTTQVKDSFRSSLEHLQTKYVDSYVLHGPASGRGITDADREVWRAMEQIHKAGSTRLLGVSNVSLEQLERMVEFADVPPAFVQNRCFARSGWDRAVRAFCTRYGIVYQGFSLLTANERELFTPPIARIVERTGKTLAQVVFRFATQVGMLPLTGTSSAEHMRDDLACFDFELSGDEVETIENIAHLPSAPTR